MKVMTLLNIIAWAMLFVAGYYAAEKGCGVEAIFLVATASWIGGGR
jgi:hypothetical protein